MLITRDVDVWVGMAGGLPDRLKCMSKARECIALHVCTATV